MPKILDVLDLLPSRVAVALQGLDIKQVTMSFVCVIFLVFAIYPSLIVFQIFLNFESWLNNGPNYTMKMLLYIVPSAGEDFSRLTTFMVPIFAIIAGFRSRGVSGSLSFLVLVSLSLFGVFGSLGSKYFILSDDGQKLLSALSWIGDKSKVTQWSDNAKTFYNSSFQASLSFVSVLLGLKASETTG